MNLKKKKWNIIKKNNYLEIESNALKSAQLSSKYGKIESCPPAAAKWVGSL